MRVRVFCAPARSVVPPLEGLHASRFETRKHLLFTGRPQSSEDRRLRTLDERRTGRATSITIQKMQVVPKKKPGYTGTEPPDQHT